MGSAFEVRASVADDGTVHYLMSGLDNVRPLSDDAINGFLDRRAKYSDVAAVAAALSRLKFVGSADDSAAYRGAGSGGKLPAYADWLMVQGHTHVPAAVPGEYYNLGTWMSTLVGRRREEKQVEAFPFLLVFRARTAGGWRSSSSSAGPTSGRRRGPSCTPRRWWRNSARNSGTSRSWPTWSGRAPPRNSSAGPGEYNDSHPALPGDPNRPRLHSSEARSMRRMARWESLPSSPRPACRAADDKAEAVVKKAIEAHGGAENLNKYTAGQFTMKGDVSVMGMDLEVLRRCRPT